MGARRASANLSVASRRDNLTECGRSSHAINAMSPRHGGDMELRRLVALAVGPRGATAAPATERKRLTVGHVQDPKVPIFFESPTWRISRSRLPSGGSLRARPRPHRAPTPRRRPRRDLTRLGLERSAGELERWGVISVRRHASGELGAEARWAYGARRSRRGDASDRPRVAPSSANSAMAAVSIWGRRQCDAESSA